MNPPLDSYQETVERLARGEEIMVLDHLAHAAERQRLLLDRRAEAFRAAGSPTVESVDPLLSGDDDDELIGTAFALATYGRKPAMRRLAAALTHIGQASIHGGGGYVAHLEAGTAVVGRLLWALTAQGLAVGNPAVLSLATEAKLPTPRGEPAVVMAADRRLRYAAACTGDAAETFQHYRDWLGGLDLVGRASPYLAYACETFMLEADFVFALAAAETRFGRTYAEGLRDEVMLSRFAARLQPWSSAFCAFIGIAETGLIDEVVRRADLLMGPRDPFGDRSPLRRLLSIEEQ